MGAGGYKPSSIHCLDSAEHVEIHVNSFLLDVTVQVVIALLAMLPFCLYRGGGGGGRDPIKTADTYQLAVPHPLPQVSPTLTLLWFWSNVPHNKHFTKILIA